MVLVAGVFLALIGAGGDLVWHGLHPDRHAALLALGSAEAPWHLALFAGLALAAGGSVAWAVGLRTEAGAAVGAALALLLLLMAGAGAWSLSVNGEEPAGTGGVAAHRSVEEVAPAGPVAGTGHPEVGSVQPTTREQWAEVRRQLEEVRETTRKYMDVRVAEADGYFQVTQFIPGIAMHYYNPAYRGVFDPLHPQVLLYMPVREGKLRLVGVAYQLPRSGDTTPDGFPGGRDIWHSHENLCFLPGGTVTVSDAPGCAAAGGLFRESTGWLLHAWIFPPRSPDGVLDRKSVV